MSSASILVAGRTGQLARSLSDAGRALDIEIVALGRPDLDLADADSVARATESLVPRAIVNAAAYTNVDGAEIDEQAALTINRDGAARLAAAAQRMSVPFLHVSTDYVFDGTKSSPYREDDAPAPLNAYGRSKLAGEEAVFDACPSAVVLRTSWVYSPYGHNFVKTMLRIAEKQDTVPVVVDQHGAPTAAGDLADAILTLAGVLAAAPSSARRGGIYHMSASGEATTWHGFAAAIFSGWARRGHRVPRLEPDTSARGRRAPRDDPPIRASTAAS